MWVHLRSRDITVSRNSLARCNGRHLRIRHLVQFILAGPVYHNALTNCATRYMLRLRKPPTCVAERYLTLRTGCERYGRKKSSAVPFFSQRSHLGNLRQTIQERVIHKRVETAGCLPSCAPARRQRNFPRFASDTPAALHQNAKEEHCCLAVSLFAHITGFCFPDFSAVPHGGALLRSPEALSPALQRTRVSPGRCAYARDSRSYPRTGRAFSADD